MDDLEPLMDQYNNVLRELLDKHAPELKKQITIRPTVPWYNDTIRDAKLTRRKLERQWRRTHLPAHRVLYQQQRKKVIQLIDMAKSSYFEEKIAQCNDSKDLFRVVDTLLHRKGKPQLPPHENVQNLVEEFSDYFHNKIATIRQTLDAENDEPYDLPLDEIQQCEAILSEFNPVTEDELLKIIRKMQTKSCPLDPLPTWLVKELLPELIPVMTKIVNLSLTSGSVPPSMKLALVSPLLKKILFAIEILKNYRAVSNLPFMAKVTEKVAAGQLIYHMKENDLDEKFQSSYKAQHSTETALLCVHNDLLRSIDDGKRCNSSSA
jgi:hypothetical protein